ncbi:MAG: thermonuclease family protein [Steroidobacteraceae bacterium]
MSTSTIVFLQLKVRSFVFIAIALFGTELAHGHPGALDGAGCHATPSTHKIHCHPQWAAQLPPLDEEGVFTGVVCWVMDGDTLQVLVRGRAMDVRLAEVDAPERAQPYGWEATLTLIDLVRNRTVRVAPYDVDRYGRVVAHVYLGERDVGRELVQQGAAWFYSHYASNADLYAVEGQARAQKRGLWALAKDERVEPWEWRRRQRSSLAPSPTLPGPAAEREMPTQH